MANTRFQVKRTSVSGRIANTTDTANSTYIAAGEFALNMTDDILYTSDGTNIIEIGSNNSTIRVSSYINVGTATVNSTIYTGTAANASLLNNLTSASFVNTASTHANSAGQDVIISGTYQSLGANLKASGVTAGGYAPSLTAGFTGATQAEVYVREYPPTPFVF